LFKAAEIKPIQQHAQSTLQPFGSLINASPSKPAVSTTHLQPQQQPAPSGGAFNIGNLIQSNIFKASEPKTFGSLLNSQLGDGAEDESGNQNPEEYEPEIDFKPIVQLKEVEVKTGEEDDDVLFKARCKLFKFDSEAKDWKEKGLGDMKLLQNRQNKSIRVLMRREQVLKLCANHKITPDMKLKEMTPKQYSWAAMDFSDPDNPKTEMLLARFGTEETAKLFDKEFEKAVEFSKTLNHSNVVKASEVVKLQPAAGSDKPSLAQALKSDKWKCTACYAPNEKDSVKCACCQTPKPGAAVSTNNLPTSFTSPAISSNLTASSKVPESKSQPFSFGFTQPQNGASSQTKPTFSFGALSNTSSTLSFGAPSTDSTTKPLFGTQQLPINEQQKPVVLFEKPAMPSFAALANQKPNAIFGNLDTTTSASPVLKPFGFGAGLQAPVQSPKPLFGAPSTIPSAQTGNNEAVGEEGNENPEEYEPQVDFKPIVQLSEVDVKTGEEDEEAVFRARCKLYRYESKTNEWKEKGVGDMKLLRHKENRNVFRVLMRREQILKLCANHRITSDLKFEIFNEKQVRWHAEDYSENVSKHELLAARFKNEQEAKKFKEECENAQNLIHVAPESGSTQTKELNKEVSDSFNQPRTNLDKILKKII
jgi:E3 SUMO-protein ligase RanBP2